MPEWNPRKRREEFERTQQKEETVVEEPTSSFMPEGDYENTLMQLRNAGPEDNVEEALESLRRERRWYNDFEAGARSEFDSMRERITELEEENARLFIRAGENVKEEQNKDIMEDGEDKSYESLWPKREG